MADSQVGREVSSNTLKQKPLETELRVRLFFQENGKFIFALLVVFALCMFNTFAASGETIEELDTWGDKILSLISASWVQALMTIALVIEFGIIGFGNAQGEGGMFKKLWPWMVGTVGILGASSITDFFWNNN